MTTGVWYPDRFPHGEKHKMYSSRLQILYPSHRRKIELLRDALIFSVYTEEEKSVAIMQQKPKGSSTEGVSASNA